MPPDATARRAFLQASAVLASGTAGGHVVTMLAMLVLPRLYAPADFGTLAVYTGVVATIGVAACLRFDVALALPEDERDAAGLLALSLASALAVALATLGAVALLPALRERLPAGVRGPAVWLLAPGVLAFAALSALQNWNVRGRQFGTIARARIGQSATAGGVQIAGGAAGAGGLLLAGGLLSGYVTGSLLLARRVAGPLRHWLATATRAEARSLAARYRRFPQFSTWEALANNAAIQVPVILIAARATAAEAGFVAWAMYVIQAPMSLLGSAVAQAYLAGAPREHARGELGRFTLDVLAQLTAVGLGPLLALAALAPVGFPIVFGPAWERAGWLVAWMLPWFFLQLLASPVSMALHVSGRQRTALALQLFGLVLRVSVVLACAAWRPGVLGEAYALSGAAFYGVYLVVVLVAVGIPAAEFWAETGRALRWPAIWMMGAITAVLVLAALGGQAGLRDLVGRWQP